MDFRIFVKSTVHFEYYFHTFELQKPIQNLYMAYANTLEFSNKLLKLPQKWLSWDICELSSNL
ncbi:hypothetical protein A1343_17700 [Leptospira interrogans serovar Bataviae]|nr:hypothetical protein [Leptospira interrogans serovar Bataviae]OAM85518.1 hypothetical protein A1343_17700 [Leptospira interrogans serovar Bataviae]